MIYVSDDKTGQWAEAQVSGVKKKKKLSFVDGKAAFCRFPTALN